MCTRVVHVDLLTIHHEMGHIQYYLQYKNLPPVYRDGANPGFHEAVGDVLALSASTKKHLVKLGLTNNSVDDKEAQVNQYLRMGLEKLAFLPFAYVMDKYRYGVFRGTITKQNANCKFWGMRDQFGGLEPPVFRSNVDFDPTAKYHVSADVEYLRYFVSFIVQFQFHKAVCQAAGEYIPGDPTKTLNDCDIGGKPEAGNLFK